MKKLFIFGGNYAVKADSREAAIKKLTPFLKAGHKWYSKTGATNKTCQGHLEIREFAFDQDVAVVSTLNT